MEKLFEAALNATKYSYSPYSKFKVGAAVLLKNGQIITGANIENASFGLTNCAERSCLFTLYSSGYTKDDVACMCVAGFTKEPISPCGACRQVFVELLNKDTKIYLINDKKMVKETSVAELLPYSFQEVENV